MRMAGWAVLFAGMAGICAGQTPIEYTISTGGSQPAYIAAGPDGNLWFTESGANKIGKISTGGVIVEYVIPTANSVPAGIVTGPDGNLWFTENGAGKIGKITTAGTITEYVVPTTASAPLGIVPGPDGNLWFAENGGNKIGKITTGGAITEYPTATGSGGPAGMAAGPDGNLWFTEHAAATRSATLPPASAITEYPIPTGGSVPQTICAGPDGNLWFTERDGNKIGKITTGGAITEYAIVPTSSAAGLGRSRRDRTGTFGSPKLSEIISTESRRAGYITPYGLPTNGSGPEGIVEGPDGDLWFTEFTSGKIGRIAPGMVTSTLPHVADGDGFDTLILLVNTSTVSANYSLQFFNQNGGSVTYPLDPTQAGMSGTITAGSQAIVRTTGSGSSTNLGWGQLTAPPLVKGVVIYQQQASPTSLQEGSAPIGAASSNFFVPFDNTNGDVTSIGFCESDAVGERVGRFHFVLRAWRRLRSIAGVDAGGAATKRATADGDLAGEPGAKRIAARFGKHAGGIGGIPVPGRGVHAVRHYPAGSGWIGAGDVHHRSRSGRE